MGEKDKKQKIKEYTIITLLVIISIGLIFLIQTISPEGPTGYVTLTSGTPNTTTFFTQNINLTCNATAEEGLINISATITNDQNQQTTTTQTVTGQNAAANLEFINLNNGAYNYTCTACSNENCDQSQILNFNIIYNITSPQTNPVINITFNEQTNPWKDYSNANHPFTKQGSTSWEDTTNCKWYGCADMTSDSGDYITSNTRFSLENGISISFWIKPTQAASGENSQAYYELGTGSTYKYTEEGSYGPNTKWNAQTGQAGGSIGEGYTTPADQWTHYFFTYDETRFILWKNGEVIKNTTQSYGNLNYSINEAISIGKGIYGIDLIGYLDEFLIWNRANFTDAEIKSMYNQKKSGTPPDLDLYIKNATYTMPYDWSSPTNELNLAGNLAINITIANAGQTNKANSFTTKVYIDNTAECTHTTSLDPGEEKTFTCNWPKTPGWHKGNITIDSGNDIDEESYEGGSETNNVYYLYIPMESHPRFRFNKNSWENTLRPWFTNPANENSNQAYQTYKSFISENFNSGWTANDVDPRGKKGFENALNCYINNFSSATACSYAKNHLQGWLVNVTDWQDGSVQAIHEVIHVAATYDLMFPNLTQTEAELYGKKIHDLCMAIYGKSNLQLHNDEDIPSPDNGKGFGTGMSAPCYIGIGDNPNNPNMVWDDPQSYNEKNTIYYWTKRIDNHLKGFKNDSESIYPEGMLYHWYSKYHLANMLWFLKRTNISTVTQDHQNAICSFTKEATRNILDHTYNGNTLRGDTSEEWRQISFGDTYSYQPIGDYGVDGWDVITIYGLLCDDEEIKQAARKLRYLGYETGAQTGGVGALYYYPLLAEQAEIISDIGTVMPAYSFAESFDRLTIRRGYTYENDSLFIIDGGDEAQGGHPNAEFVMFAYVYGEPFLDFTQVPYEDDVRSEVWANTISFSQSTATGYNTNPGTAILNQYYGGAEITGTYPNFNYMPAAYRGDVEHTIGTEDGMYAAARTYKPYTTTTAPVERNFVIFQDLLVHTDYVKRTISGPIYANWINIYNEFTPTISGNNLTLRRAGTNKYYKIMPMWSSAGQINLTGGNSGKKFCFQKTSCSPGGNGNYGKYYHTVNGPNANTLFAHHWYQTTDPATISLYTGTDKGIQATYTGYTTFIIMDTNEDGSIDEQGYSTDGWSLSIKENILAATGATEINEGLSEIYSSSITTSAYLDFSEVNTINATVSTTNSTTISIDLNGATTATLEIDGEAIGYGSYTISSGKLTTTISKGNHHIYIQKGGDGSPTVTQNSPSPFFLSENSSEVFFSCSATDDNKITNTSILTNSTGILAINYSEFPNNASHTLTKNITFQNGTYQWACRATDNASQTTTSSTRTFTVGQPINNAPTVNATSPASNYSTVASSETFTCTATDTDGNLATISILTDEDGNFTTTYSEASSGSSDTITKSISFAPGNYTWACRATDTNAIHTTTQNKSIEFRENITPPIYTGFDGSTTDFGALGSFANVEGIILEKTAHGKIKFNEPINTIAGLDFSSAVNISNRTIRVNATMYNQLNVSAQLSFYNLNLNTPLVKKDGTNCSTCYNGTYTNGTYTFNVTSFSTFTVEEYVPPTIETGSNNPSGGGGKNKGGGMPPQKNNTKTKISANTPAINSDSNEDQEQENPSSPLQETPAKLPENNGEQKNKTPTPYFIIIGIILALTAFFVAKTGNKKISQIRNNVKKEIKKKSMKPRLIIAKITKNQTKLEKKYLKMLEEYNAMSEKDKAKYYEQLLEVYNKIERK